ncbi:MAG: hypothetical protein HRU40_18695 [Saprospiraceae bacterium]|nr:hypothetical protein [Saprospiraceae bacterium]
MSRCKAFLLAIGCIFFGCEEDPGCLDVLATNFQVDAEDPCGDCCRYPAFRLSIRHRWSTPDTTVSFATDTSGFSSGNYRLRFDNVHFYLSNLQLVASDGTTLNVFDRFDITISQGSDSTEITILDDLLLVDAGSFQTYVTGTYRGSGIFESLEMSIGVSEPGAQGTPDDFPDDHPLFTQNPAMYDTDQGYRNFRVGVYPELSDTIATVISGFSSGTLPTISLPISFQLDKGYFTDIELAIDYSTWFAGIDWNTMSEEEIFDIILSQQVSSLEVIGVSSSLN